MNLHDAASCFELVVVDGAGRAHEGKDDTVDGRRTLAHAEVPFRKGTQLPFDLRARYLPLQPRMNQMRLAAVCGGRAVRALVVLVVPAAGGSAS